MDKYYKIKGYEDYFITKSGKIFSTITNKELKYKRDCDNYCEVELMDRRLGRVILLKVHRIVANQFIPNPRKLPDVYHKDGNKTNNSVYNLEWCTSEYKQRKGNDNPKAKLTERQVTQIYKDYETCKNKKAIAKEYNVSDALIQGIVTGSKWSRVYREYYGKESEYIKPKRRKLSQQELRHIIWKYYVEHKNINTIEQETDVDKGYISKVVRGIVYPKEFNAYLLEIKKKLDNQQPNQ